MRQKKTLPLVILALAGALLLTGCDDLPTIQALGSTPEPLEANVTTVSRIVDGDTIAVNPVPGLEPTNKSRTEHTVRILGIDAPETEKTVFGEYTAGECGGDEATQHLESLIPVGTEVVIKPDAYADTTDRYGRSLAYVEILLETPVDVGLAMIEQGYVAAWVPRGEPRTERYDVYMAAQEAAQTGKAGSWAQCETMGRS